MLVAEGFAIIGNGIGCRKDSCVSVCAGSVAVGVVRAEREARERYDCVEEFAGVGDRATEGKHKA